MKKSECEIGMNVSFKSDTEKYGTIVKLKPIVVVVSVYDAEFMEEIDYEISYDRVWKEN